jgi:hypothetical protein
LRSCVGERKDFPLIFKGLIFLLFLLFFHSALRKKHLHFLKRSERRGRREAEKRERQSFKRRRRIKR